MFNKYKIYYIKIIIFFSILISIQLSNIKYLLQFSAEFIKHNYVFSLKIELKGYQNDKPQYYRKVH